MTMLLNAMLNEHDTTPARSPVLLEQSPCLKAECEKANHRVSK